MTPINKIRDAGYKLELDGENLAITPFSRLTPNQLAFLKTHKAEIVRALKLEQAANDKNLIDYLDDRRHCRECQNLINGRCTASKTRYHPVDDIPRRCADFLEGV